MKNSASPERLEWPDHNALFRFKIGPPQPPQLILKVFKVSGKFRFCMFVVYFFDPLILGHFRRELLKQ